VRLEGDMRKVLGWRAWWRLALERHG